MIKRLFGSVSAGVYRSKPLTTQGNEARNLHVGYAEPTVCPDCNAVYRQGHWQWLALPRLATWRLCPACERIRTDAPAGYVYLEGAYVSRHREALLSLVTRVSEQEKAIRPLNRIIETVDAADGTMLVSTTDGQLARIIGEALQHAHHGVLAIQQGRDAGSTRVIWRR